MFISPKFDFVTISNPIHTYIKPYVNPNIVRRQEVTKKTKKTLLGALILCLPTLSRPIDHLLEEIFTQTLRSPIECIEVLCEATKMTKIQVTLE